MFSRILISNKARKHTLKTIEIKSEKAPSPTKKMSKKKSTAKKDVIMKTTEEETTSSPKIILVDVPGSKAMDKKESFTNDPEADTMIDYYVSSIQTANNGDFPKGQNLLMTSPFRTQAHLIKAQMQDRG